MSRTRKESGEGTIWLTEDQERSDAILTLQVLVRELHAYLKDLESEGAKKIVRQVRNELIKQLREFK